MSAPWWLQWHARRRDPIPDPSWRIDYAALAQALDVPYERPPVTVHAQIYGPDGETLIVVPGPLPE